MNQFDDFFRNNTSFLDNAYVSNILIVFLVMYANSFAPKVPKYFTKIFDNIVGKFIMAFLMFYMYNKNPTLSLICTLVLVAGLTLVSNVTSKENMASESDYGSESESVPDLKSVLENDANILLVNFNNMVNNALNFITSQEGKTILEETANEVENGNVHMAEAEMIINKIIQSEDQGKSPLVATSEEGAKQMASIEHAVEQGKIAAEEGQRYAAQVVIKESVDEARQELNLQTSEQDLLAQEVFKRKHSIEKNTGSKMTKIQLRQLCAQIEQDYFNQKMNEVSQISGLTEFNGFDDYAPFHTR